jgi:hypothetical protein
MSAELTDDAMIVRVMAGSGGHAVSGAGKRPPKPGPGEA